MSSKEIETLERERSEALKYRKQYRKAIYGRLPEVLRAAEAIRKNPELQKELEKVLGDTLPDKAGERFFLKLLTKIVRYVFVINSKMAWKRARAILFLRDVRKIPTSDLAKVLAKSGGIEKVCREACEKDPLSIESDTDKKTSKLKIKPKSGKHGQPFKITLKGKKWQPKLRQMKAGTEIQLIGTVSKGRILKLKSVKILG